MEWDFANYLAMFFIGVCSLAILALAVGYMRSAVAKHYAEKRVQRNNEQWLACLLNDQCDDMLCALQNHPKDFLTWMVSLPGGDYEKSIVAFETYINLLNTCSLLEIYGVIPRAVFWNKLGDHLKAIAACKELGEFITTQSCKEGLRRKLLEMERCKK